MNEHEQESRVRAALSDAYPADALHFRAGFADRVMARIAANAAPADDLATALMRRGRRVLPALAAASIALIAWNWTSTRDSADSVVTAALGIQRDATAPASGLTTLQGAEAFQ